MQTDIEIAQIIQAGANTMGITLSDEVALKLAQYVKLLEKWSYAYNLTTIRTVDKIIPLHILDSLVLTKHLQNCQHVLDVGTGAGLPGIPLAILNPHINFTLLDSQQKKITFLQHVLTCLQLTNVKALHERVERLQVSYRFDMVVSRAFASLDEFVKLIRNVCDTHTQIIAMKAKDEVVAQEMQKLPSDFELVNIEKVYVPDIFVERCLVFLRKI